MNNLRKCTRVYFYGILVDEFFSGDGSVDKAYVEKGKYIPGVFIVEDMR